MILTKLVEGLPFDRDYWKLLVGEMLLVAAAEVPEIQTVPETLLGLLERGAYQQEALERHHFPPILQAHYGTRDLSFGGKIYRPEKAGYNDAGDVSRLALYLAAQDPEQWSSADLEPLHGQGDDTDREDELEFAREWFPALRDLYRRAQSDNRVVVCEII